MRLLRAAARTPVPWKNGGGVTSEIAVSPPGASFDDFDWRISMARVDADGPFSSFPDIDRTLTILSGTMTLDIDGSVVRLDAGSPPCRFDGAAAVMGTVAGPVHDLNTMTRRRSCRHLVTVLRIDRDLRLPARRTVRLLFACDAGIAANGIALFQHDAVLLAAGRTPLHLRAASPARAVLIDLWDRPARSQA